MKLHRILAAALVAVTSVAGAQTLKPGLWEVTHKTSGVHSQPDQQMAQMQKQMAAMPPGQRKQMEEMMGKQGLQMGGGAPGAMSMKMCMTKEMAERSEIPAQQGDCKTTQQSRSGNTLKVAFTCTNPPSSGEGQYTFTGAEAYTMKMAVTTTVQGKPQKMNMEGSGKWLGADCGNVKPVAPPKK